MLETLLKTKSGDIRKSDLGLLMQNPNFASYVANCIHNLWNGTTDVTVVLSPNTPGSIVLCHEVATSFLMMGAKNIRSIWAGWDTIGVRQDQINWVCHQEMSIPEWTKLKPTDKVVIVQDMVYTGTQIQELKNRVKESGASLVGVACIVNLSSDESIASLASLGNIKKLLS